MLNKLSAKNLTGKQHPLLQSQLGVFIECMQYPDCTQYNLPTITPLGREVDLDRMEKAFHVVYNSRVAWRLRFGIDDEGNPYQYDDTTKEFHVVHREMTDAEFQEYAHKGFCRPFDLMGDEPLIRVELVSTEVQGYALMDVHHLIMDGVSYTTLFSHNDFKEAYRNGSLSVETYTLLDAADDEQQTLHSESYKKSCAYYAEKYSDIDFATLSSRPASPLGQMLRVHEYVGKAEVDAWCREHDVAVNLLFQAAFSYVMSVLLRQDKIAYTTVTHGRFDRRWRNIYGMFSREVPVMSELKDGQTVIDYIRSFRAELISTIRYSDYPISHLCRDLRKNLGTTFNFFATDESDEYVAIEDHGYYCKQVERASVTIDMNVEVYLSGTSYDIRVDSSEAMNGQETLQMVAHAIGVTLKKMMQQPNALVKSLSIVSKEEEQQLIKLGTGERHDYDKSKNIIDLFREQAEKTPDAVAVVDYCSQLTYKELDEASDEYAKTVTSGTFVCVEMPRVKEFVVAVLGIWKAGSAYVPIDMEYPEERKRFMREECDGKPLPQPDVAYMIYTSGSTGKPKGVMVQHSALMNFIMATISINELSAEDRISAHRSFAFDAHIEDFYPVLAVGASVHIMPEEIRMDLDAIYAYLISHEITGGGYTTAIATMLLKNYDLKQRYITCGGEALRAVKSSYTKIINVYGPTECTDHSAIFTLDANKNYDIIPIGHALQNTQCLVLDANNQLIPQGTLGELCISGPQLALGYYNNPELTAERFVNVTINGKTERIYKTGDLCRWNNDGQLEYIGRIDNQIKLRGFRIELGEIESAALQIDGINQAVAVVKNEQIVLYYTGESNSPFERDLEGRLPDFMIPSVYVPLDVMPLTPNGKIDRKALPEPVMVQEEYVAPRNEIERIIAVTLKEVLALDEDISMTSRFYSLGGDSIHAMRLASKLHQQGVNISVNQILSLATVENIAASCINESEEEELFFPNMDGYYSLSDTSRAMLVSDFGTQYGAYSHTHCNIFFDGTDTDRLIHALIQLLVAHPFLKARIKMHNTQDDPMWYRDDHRDVPIAIRYVSSVHDIFEEFTPYNLFEDDLIRLTIYVAAQQMLLSADFCHLIMDGISVGLFEHELRSAYSSPDKPVISLTPTGYDLCAIEQRWLESGDNRQKAELYFDSLLRDAVAMPYPYSRTVDEGQQSYSLSKLVKNSVEISEFCKRESITVNTYLQTALLCALMRILRQDKLMMFCTSSGRNALTQNVMGNLAKSLPLVGNQQWIESDARTVINEAAKQYSNTLQHEMYPTNELVSKFNAPLHLLYTSEILTDTGLFDEDSLIDISREIAYKGEVITFFLFRSVQGNYALSLSYDGSLYSRRDMQSLLDAWHLMACELRRQNCAVKQLPIVTAEEQQRLLALGDGDVRIAVNTEGYHLLPADMTVVEHFVQVAHNEPTKEIVIDRGGAYTCEQLNLYSNKVAHWLVREGMPRGAAIGIETPRCKEYMALAMGVLKADCAIVTIEEDYPEERKQQIVEEADVRVVLTLECLQQILDSNVSDEDICLCTVDSTFQIFFTSGTTGTPKGVVRSLAELTHDMNNAVVYGLHPADAAMINIVRFSFVACIGTLWLPVGYGNPSHILSQDVIDDQTAISEYIRKNKITYSLMPSTYGVMLINNHDLPLRDVFLAAEKIQPITNRDVRASNLYACTEVLWVSSKVISPEDTHLTAGMAPRGTQIYIMDEHQNLLPQGITGEICVSSNTMARGYLNDPELNARKFIKNPFFPERRLLRTGDLGYLDENGELNVVGRMDNMVKLRGFRIELDEITHHAMQCPGIDMCACTKHENDGGEFLCCYYTSSKQTGKDIVKSYLAKHLPPYMVPEVYMRIDKMPLNANGKIDRKALPEPEREAESTVLPATKAEQEVLGVVEDMMGISPISVTANLISLGLSSITAMRLAMRLTQQLGETISMSQLMASPTIRDIAANLQSVADSNLGKVRDKQEYYPLTDNQLGVYLDWEQHRDGLQYNVPVTIKLNGYDANRLQAAITTAVAAHPYLFARLAITNGQVRIKRNEPQSYHCGITELEEEPTDEFFQSRVQPFNLFEDSLFRFEIYTYGETTYLFKDIHHIITDGVSDGQLMSEIFAAYKGEPIQAETYTAYDRAIEEQEIKESTAYTESAEYYKTLLSDVESTVYPHSTCHLSEGKAQYVRNTLSKETIESRCASFGVTPSNYLLAVFMEVLKRITREDKVMITTVNSGREHAAMQNIQGFFVKTLPVISAATPAEIQRQLIESISHECYPLTEMVQTMGIHPEIIYVYEGGLFDDERIREKNDMSVISLSLDTVKMPLTLTVNPEGNHYALNIEYDDALYNEQDMQTLLHSIIVLAENYAKETSASLQDCSMLTDEEEQRLIELGTGDTLNYDKSKTFIDLFKDQAKNTPEAIAVVDATSQLTYKELDEASDEYAKTVISGTFVCVEMPRVKEFVVAVLGIWKASSAYVPIDIEYPEERKRFMREECDGKPLPQPDVAYMIYTSGSTGKPKGVMVQHSALMNFIMFQTAYLPLHSDSRIACHTNLAFDASIKDLYAVLTVGGALYLVPERLKLDIPALHRFFADNKITGCNLVTAFGNLFCQDHRLELDYITFGGEALNYIPDNSGRVFNTYGPTETTVDVTYYECVGTENPLHIPIGYPIPNNICFLVDTNNHLIPKGVVGELCILGPQVALGYYNNPELTAERFVEVPINGKQERIYRTGDLCRWNSEGRLEYIGRIDNQIKLRGFRIELGEIESAAMQVEGIMQAVAVVKNEQIVLYYVNETACAYEDEMLRYENLLRSNLSLSLPEYMVPSVYVHLGTMPLTPNGKIDRKALPEPEYKSESIVLPATKAEHDVLGVVEGMMGISPVGVTANLISLGLSSISAMRLAMRLSQQLGKTISMSQLMSSPTIRNIAANLMPVADSNLGKARDKQEYYPLTDNQLGVYLDWEQHRDGLQYNVPVAIRLKGYDANRLQAAISTAVAAHPYLFAQLAITNGEVRIKRNEPQSYHCSITQLKEEPADEFFQSRVQPFNLFEDSLFRFEIYTYSETTYLFEDIHHIITDGVSDAQLMSEIFAAYNGETIETETYTAYDRAVEEQEIKESTAYTEAEEYYKTLLSDVESTQYPHSLEKIGEGMAKYVHESLGKKAIEHHCASLGVTPSNYLLAVFMEVLKRITREEKVMITTVNSGREHAAMQHIQGFFVKTLPVVSADTPAEIQHQLIESISHECYPLTEMVQTLGIHPEIMYAYEGGLMDDEKIRGINDLTIIPLSLDTVKLPLTLTVNPGSEDYELSIEYNDALYSEADMQTLLHSIIVLAENYAKETSASLQDCSMLTEEEEHRLIELGTGERLDYDRSKTFIDLFGEQVKKTPDAIAVVDYCSQLTYRELDEASDEYAKTVTSGTFVCVEMPRVKEFVIAVLGIWKAGSAYVPIDMEYPEERKRFMREECDGKPLPQPDIAYMIYTSGSTGKPKGVMNTHIGLLNFIFWNNNTFVQHPETRHIVHSSFSFDATLFDIFCPLAVGATVHIIKESLRYDLNGLASYIRENNITGMLMTPQVGAELLLQGDLPLDYIILGGDKMPKVQTKGIDIYNAYGPTEFTSCSSIYRLQSKERESVPIGIPVPNTLSLICDKEGNILPRGVVGELCLAGLQISLGYWNNPELTAERFVGIMLNGKKERMYRTGDLCRWNSEGQLEYIGRLDNQVKLRGFRIELGEIDSTAMQIDGIKQVVAVVKDEQIVLYYVNETACAYADETLRYENLLRSNLSLSLPEYMVPSVYVHLAAMPLTPNGKIDRKALPEPVMVQEEYVAPRNETERVIADTFKEVLTFDTNISVTSRFYSLGGDSIKSIRLVSLLAQKGYILSVADVMKLQTPEALAAKAVNTDAEEENFALMLPVTKRYPLTSMQEAMLLKHLSDPDSWGYRLVSRYKLNIVLTGNQLRAALNALATEHETLRTRIIYKGIDVPEQEITDREIPVSFEDIRETGRTIAEIHTEQLNRGFDLEEDSLMRVVCIVTADNECQLLIAMHHIITDGWSTPIYLSHFFQHLKDAIEGKDIEITESDAGMFEQHVRSLQMRDKDASLQYWHDLLEGYETKAEITSYEDDNENDNKDVNDHLSLELSKEQTERLKSVCSANNATLSHATELAWGIVLQRYTRQDDVVFAKVVSCRDKAPMDMSHVVGPFINSIPVRVKTDGNQTIGKALNSISQQAAESNAHDYCSMSEIQQQSELGSNLFQSILAFENYPVSDEIKAQFDEANATFTVEPQDNQEESFNDITLTAYERDGQLCLNLTYDKEKYAERDMQAVLLAWQHVLMQTAKTPEASINEIGLLSEEEEQRLIELGTGERLDYDRSKTFIDLFKEQVAKTPDATAVVDATSQLTYKELDEASDEYAKTVTPHTFVCVEMPRVKEFVVAVLGIWKAGSAYVPIDMEYPEERKRFMREECDGKPLPQAGIAYMIYTSGSTGKPKGVMISHDGLTNYIYSTIAINGVLPSDRISAYRSFSFDSHIEEFYPTLAVGASVYIVPEEIRHDTDLLYQFIKDNHIDGCYFPTRLAELLYNGYDLPVRFIGAVGERLTNVISGKNGVQFLNTYGPTECTDHISAFVLENGSVYKSIPIGRPLHNGKVFIIDSSHHLVPEGCVGELSFSSVQLAVGYYNNPELTAERFVNVTLNGKKERIYKTGDLCRWNREGQLEYIGRIDNQIKLRGFRIELGEIESAAMQIDSIKQAVVVVKNEQIVLYYVNETACAYEDETLRYENLLRSNLSLSLPEYMVPSAYVHLDAMPLTPNGKIDRKNLPEPEYKSDNIVLPVTKAEQDVLGAVEDMMGISPVSVTANLISLGLSSIAAMRLAMRLSQQLGKTISMSQLMSSPTIRDIAANLNSVADSNLGKVRDKQEYYPLTDNQLGVYLDWEQHRDGLQYNVPVAIKLNGYDANRLQTAITTAVAAHPYLFARLAITNGEVRIKRNESQSYHCAITELEEEPTDEFFQSRVQPFNLFEDSLFRFEIYTYGETVYLFKDIHHIITDGVSDAQLMSEIFAAYNGETIEAETYTAYDRAIEEQEIKESAAYTEAAEYYKTLLSDVESTVYPHSLRHDSGQTTEGTDEGMARYVHGSLGKKAIEHHCASLGVTPGNYLLAVFMEVLKRITREDKVMITTVNSGREHAAMQHIQGFFVKTLPVISADTPAEIQHQLIESISHECYPLTEMVQTMGIHPEILYAYEGGLFDDERIREKNDISVIPLSLDTVKVPLTLTVNPGSEDYELSIEYNDALYSEADMQALLHSIIVLAENYAKETSASLQDCSMLTEEEEHRLIELGTGERLDYDRSKTFIDLFREQVKKTPEAIAVVDATSQLTYKELDEASDEYAKTVTSGTFVCVEMPRVKEFVVAVLGIWKAGSAYVPIDMEYPEERKRFMREECDGKPLPQPDVAYMIYTSGSTGKPKGVVVLHKGVVNYIHSVIEKEDLTSLDRIAAYRSFSFDSHIEDLYPILVTGGRLYVVSEETRQDPEALCQYLQHNKITGIGLPTQMARIVINNYVIPSLRFVTAGGEKLEDVFSKTLTIINEYGPTECTVEVSYFTLPQNSRMKTIPIGRPLPNVTCYVVDSSNNILPQGSVGELVVGGAQLSLGYYNNPDLTTERFVKLAINGKQERIYKTGDLCRWNKEGQLEYIGRIDNQVKLRGFRIELGEIESAAMQIDGIKQAGAVVKNDQIVLYYVNETACAYEDETLRYENLLRSDLSLSLPEYMVPSVYVHLDTMPLTPNGKIDRKALPEPEYNPENIVLPATKAEQDVLGVVEDMMGISPVSVTSNLISLGLSSIAAMRLAMRMSQQLGKTISMSQLMASPTIRDIAANLNSVADSNLGKMREKQEYYPLTDNQLGVYLDWEQHRDGLQYNVPVAIRLNGYDANRLQAAISTVVAAHPYLFAQLAITNGEVRIRRNEPQSYHCAITELEEEPADDFFQTRVQPFNLFEDSLFRFEIYTYKEATYLFEDIHHIITDGVSDTLLMSEIFAAYNGETIETETYTAYDRAIEELENKESSAYTEAADYYKNLLSDAESTVYPHSTEGTDEGMARYVHESLGKKAVENHCASLGVTPSNYLLAVFMEVLKRITREEKVLITTVNSGREHAAMQNIQGFFVKTLPVVSADTPAEIQHQLIENISHECYPLTEMVQTMGIHPEIMYAYEGGLMDDEKIRGINGLTIIPLALDTVKVPLTLTVYPGSEDYKLNIEYNDALYSKADMQTLLHSIIVLAENYAKTISVSLQDCSMLTDAEEQRLIELGTGERLDYPSTSSGQVPKTFIDLFGEQVKKTPDAIAVVDYCSQMTYKELDEASDEYAKTVTPGTFVCVEMPRVKEFVVAVLGIWKAGSAYVPIDMEYPEERKRFMREECDGKPLPQLDIAYMIYTSGSTGKPKGVMVQHSALLNFIQFISKEWNLTEQSRISCHSNFAFDASVEDFYPVLTVGGTLYITPEDVRMDITMTHNYIVKNGIIGGCYSTQFAQLLLLQYPDLPVEYLVVGGEKMTKCPEHVCRLINTYGPTECTVDATYYCFGSGKDYSEIPIGRPLANLKCYISDKDGNLLPQGTSGELCIAGPQLALGYYNNPELTAERFVEVTINGKKERIYKTGDLCRWNNDGQLEYIGRIDNQVKLRGFRIELGEIESAAMQVEGIKQVVAVVKDEQIVLYYVNETACAYEDETLRYENLLRSNLSLSLPEYMVPSVYVHLDALPLTPNGKIDRKALPEPEHTNEEYVAPESINEKLLCKLIEDLLGLERVGVTDSLSACGMSSIVAMRFNLLLHRSGIDMNINTILKAGNVRNICKYIEEGIDNSDIGCWLDDFDPDKPTIVLCCGVIGSNKITCNLTDWRGRYNIYVLQPIFDAWSDVEQLSHGEIVARYHEQMRRDIHGEIKCIIGFSYGGELAYHLATMWDNGESAKPIVLMGDTVIAKSEVNDSNIKIEYENEMEEYYYDLQKEFFSKREKLPLVPYVGETILISAMQEAPYKHSNEDEWKLLNPHIRIVAVDDTHQGLYEKAEHYSRYIKLIGD